MHDGPCRNARDCRIDAAPPSAGIPDDVRLMHVLDGRANSAGAVRCVSVSRLSLSTGPDGARFVIAYDSGLVTSPRMHDGLF